MMNAMSNHFGVGFRREGVAQTLEIRAQCLVILDDSIVHNGHAVAGYVRVGVVRGRNAVSRPSGMRNAHGAGDRSRIDGILEDLNLTDGAQAGDPPVLDHGKAGRIVAAVLQATQTLHEDGYRVALRNHTHNSTHIGLRWRTKKGLPSVPDPDRKSNGESRTRAI
jgi:hypothetical protein